MGAAEVVPKFLRANEFEYVRHRKHVAERLRHLLARLGDPAVVQPVLREVVTGALGLRDLVLMMREHQIQSAAVDVERLAEVEHRHRRAFEVPSGPARTPRCGPRRLARLGGLPEREVPRIPFARTGALALVDVVELVPGQPPVLGEAPDVEVDVAARRVRVTVVDEPLHHLDHLGDVPGRARLHRRRQHTQLPVGPVERTLERRGPLPPRAARLGGLVQDLVVDIGDISHERDVVVVREQPAAQHVERDATADVADVRFALDGGATQVHRGMSGGQRDEVTRSPCHGVV